MTFSVGLLAKTNKIVLFSPTKYDFNNSVSLKIFASKVATSALIVEHSRNDLEFFIGSVFRASISSFSASRSIISLLFRQGGIRSVSRKSSIRGYTIVRAV